MKKLVAAAASSLALVACGAVPQGPGAGSSPTPSASATSRAGFDVTVTERDHAATLHVGQRLLVVLHAAAGMNNWSQPRSTDETLLAPVVDPAATAARGVTLAAFQARAPGQVDVNSYAGPVCPSGLACPMYVAVYSLRVEVTPA